MTHQIPMMPSPTTAMKTSALTGVSERGRRRPNRPGRSPVRPPSKSMRAWDDVPATSAESTETIPATQASTAHPPSAWSATVRNGTDDGPIDATS